MRDTLKDPDRDPIEAIDRALRIAVKQHLDDDCPAGCMVVLAATNCSPQNEHIRKAMIEEREHTRLALRDCLQRGVESERLKPDTDVESLATFFPRC